MVLFFCCWHVLFLQWGAQYLMLQLIMKRFIAFLLLPLFCLASLAQAWQPVAEAAGEPTREFRAAWVATVFNLDWPSRAGLSAAQQKQELLQILNKAAQLRLNAIILQVRPTADALYASSHEPWSAWLSGAGVNPGYDPLAFAVAEGHKRGIEIHAWFNPFRATVSSKAVGRGHVSSTLRSSILSAGSTTMLNPSSSAAQAHVLKVIMDVVRRYDIDGVHLDDYFYPYPPHHKVADGRTPAQRRAVVDSFVKRLYSEVKSVKPWVRVGISPFGIWRPGYPSNVKAGVDAYEHLACDARKWIDNGWVDYLAPQLYWRIAGDQSFTSLMQWWSSINPKRPIWPGIASQRIKSKEDPSRTAAEIGHQMDYSRTLARQSAGQLFWSWKSIAENRGGLNAQITARYGSAAVTPAMPWCGSAKPLAPRFAAQDAGSVCRLQWQAMDRSARTWAVQARIKGHWYVLCVLPSYQTRVTLPAVMVAGADRLALRPISACGNSGQASVLAR